MLLFEHRYSPEILFNFSYLKQLLDAKWQLICFLCRLAAEPSCSGLICILWGARKPKRIFSFPNWALNKNLLSVLQYVYSLAQLWLTSALKHTEHNWLISTKHFERNKTGRCLGRPEAMSMAWSSAVLHSNLHCCGSAQLPVNSQTRLRVRVHIRTEPPTLCRERFLCSSAPSCQWEVNHRGVKGETGCMYEGN